MPYLATVVRDAGSEGAQEAFEGIQDPVFELGLRLLSEDVPKEEMARQLQVRADRELRTITGRYQQVISGMIGVREGVEPRDIEDRL